LQLILLRSAPVAADTFCDCQLLEMEQLLLALLKELLSLLQLLLRLPSARSLRGLLSNWN